MRTGSYFALRLVGLVVALGLVLAGCSANRPAPTPTVFEERDRGPDQDMDVAHIPDAVPRRELIRKAGNKSPYTVLGRTYHVDFNSQGFSQTGHASWYGKKFHGRNTSNGEVYDMFGMTAAHKTLPIPSYVRVTNLENGRAVVVRVNDRGPFHGDRIIDLSYTAAKKLGFHTKGTAKVRIDVIEASEPSPQQIVQAARTTDGVALPPNTFLQVGAFSRKQGAQALQQRLSQLTQFGTRIVTATDQQLHKVLIGPISNQTDLLNLRRILLEADLTEPYQVQL